MKMLTVFLLFICTNTLVFGQVKQNITSYSITYKIKHLGFSSTGKFDKLTADILFDEDHLKTSSIEATIETASFNSDNSMRDKDLKSDSYFDAEHYPKITIKSTSLSHISGSNYTGEFDLTVKGKTKRIELPFTYVLNGTTGKFTGSLKINRLDYGVGSSSMMLSDAVTIFINIETTVK